MKAEESVPAVRYLWVDQNLDLLSVEEEEAETGIRADTADDLGPVLLGRLYPVMDLLKSEQIEYQMALDKELHPYLLVTINSLGLEQLMEIRCIADDVTTGWFRFFIRTRLHLRQHCRRGSYSLFITDIQRNTCPLENQPNV